MPPPSFFRRARKTATLAQQFARGRAFGRTSFERLPDAPAAPGPLEQYFDSVTDGPGIWKWRHYFDIYERHFGRFVDKPVTLLEVGVFSGGSIDMWRSYFGPRAHIIGVDIEPACKSYERDDVDIVIGDQADPGFWRSFLADAPPIDIVVDDGGHEFYQQIPTFEALFPHLNPGGVYLCEDVHGEGNVLTAYMGGLQGNLHAWRPHEAGTDHVHSTTALQSVVHSMHVYPYVWVVEKNRGAVPELTSVKRGTLWQPFIEGIAFPD